MPPQKIAVTTGCSLNFWLKKQFQENFHAKNSPLDIDNKPLSISPLGLELIISSSTNSDSTNNSNNNSNNNRVAPPSLTQQLENLEKEITLRAQGFEHRPIHLLTLRDPSGSLDACDITKLIFILGQHFHLNHSGRRIYCLETQPRRLNDDYLALLKGLGFNRLQFSTKCLLPPNDKEDNLLHIRHVRERLKHLSRYQFSSANWDFHYSAEKPAEAYQQLDHLLTLKPARVQLIEDNTHGSVGTTSNTRINNIHTDTPHTNNANIFRDIFTTLRSQGYRTIGNDCFVLPQHPLAVAQQNHQLRTTVGGYNASNVADWIGLGPGLMSQLGNLYYRNHHCAKQRQEQLNNNRLPIAAGCILTHSEQVKRHALSQLNAYHQLDLNYFQSRYNLHIDTDKLNKCTPNVEYTPQTTDRQVTQTASKAVLTEQGILKLRQNQYAFSTAIIDE